MVDHEVNDTTPGVAAPVSERRLLTVLFCDLVNSTVLSARFDAEDWTEVLSHYVTAVAAQAEAFGGFVAKVMGDGVLIYFGYPRAREDDASRSMQAALAMVEAVRRLKPQWPNIDLSVRIGIATGPVVVSEMAAGGFVEQQAVVGETPNLAARLQALAEPNSVIVSQQTHDLALAEIDFVDLGPKALKGFDQPLRCWRVAGRRNLESRFVAKQPAEADYFTGRDAEVALLGECWRDTHTGTGRVVVIKGEPGVGKSQLISRIYAQARATPKSRMIFQCSELGGNVPFHPISEYFEFISRMMPADGTDARLAKLSAFVADNFADPAKALPLLTRLLSIPSAAGSGTAEQSPQEFKQELLTVLVSWLQAIARSHPLLIVVEDIYWVDASTLDLLNRLADVVDSGPILLVMTTRSDDHGFSPAQRPNVVTLQLLRLTQTASSDLVRHLLDHGSTDESVVDRIVHEADGNPLFIKQLVRVVTHEGKGGGQRGMLASSLTLQQVLQARLDNLQGGKQVAQFASILGRGFFRPLIVAAWPFDSESLFSGLAELEKEGLVNVRYLSDVIEYNFVHTLILEAAYTSLLKRDRRAFHAHVASVLESRFAELAAREPHVLARHYACAGDVARAVPFFVKATELALTRSAYVEAKNHSEQGLAALSDLGSSVERQRLELAIRPAYGTALVAVRGYSADDVYDNYERLLELARSAGDDLAEFQALLGLTRAAIVRAELVTARSLSSEFLAAAERVGRRELILTAELLVGIVYFLGGDLKAADAHLTRAVNAYDSVEHRLLAHRLGQDPGITALVWWALTLWMQGRLAEAKRAKEQALALARRLEHPFTLVYTLVRLISHERLRGDTAAAGQLAEEALELARARGFSSFEATALFWLSDLKIGSHHDPKDLRAMATEITTHAPVDQRDNVGYMLVCFAERALELNQMDEAIDALNHCMAEMEETTVRWCEAEAFRLRGRCVVAAGGPVDDAAIWFGRAMELAKAQGAPALRLRSAIELADLKRSTRDTAAAINVLEAACEAFDAGESGDELTAARGLLARLREDNASRRGNQDSGS